MAVQLPNINPIEGLQVAGDSIQKAAGVVASNAGYLASQATGAAGKTGNAIGEFVGDMAEIVAGDIDDTMCAKEEERRINAFLKRCHEAEGEPISPEEAIEIVRKLQPEWIQGDCSVYNGYYVVWSHCDAIDEMALRDFYCVNMVTGEAMYASLLKMSIAARRYEMNPVVHIQRAFENGKKVIEEVSAKKPDEYDLAVITYNDVYMLMSDAGMQLFRMRERAIDLLNLIELLVNSIANAPKSFEQDFGEIGAQKRSFKQAEEFAAKELEAARASVVGTGAGVAAGMAVASMAPTAAMWVATTFGMASTGVAISTLSGAAATNAAIAWLGGGAVAAGGGGMAVGNALLALAGPVGWGVAGATVLVSIVLFTKSKFDNNKKKHEELLSIKTNTESIREVALKIENILSKTEALRAGTTEQFVKCLTLYGANYLDLSQDQKYLLGTLVNEAKSLAALLAERASEDTVTEVNE